jgi:hypothetical protein
MNSTPKNETGNPNCSPHVTKIDGKAYLSARGVLRMVELTNPMEVKAGPSRDWIIDFQRRRPFMNEAQAIREVLKRIDCEHLMPRPKALDGGAP